MPDLPIRPVTPLSEQIAVAEAFRDVCPLGGRLYEAATDIVATLRASAAAPSQSQERTHNG